MIYPICKRGDNGVLEVRASSVRKFNGYLQTLVTDMFETMYAARGVGLAAPQIGISVQAAVIDISFGESPQAKLVLINPKILRLDGEQTAEEGCLSMPGMRMEKRRAEKVKVQAKNVDGKSFRVTGYGLLARAIQHECDHLNGVLLQFTGGTK